MIKGILFDKDGTLIDLYALWGGVCQELSLRLLHENGIDHNPALIGALNACVGITPEGICANSSFASLSYEMMSEPLSQTLSRDGAKYIPTAQITEQLERIGDEAVCHDDASYLPRADLPSLFADLKSLGLILGLATADTQRAAQHFIRKFDLSEDLNFVGSSETGGFKPKPEPEMLFEFCQRNGFAPHEVAVVGDTSVDMHFAKVAGATAVAVLGGAAGEAELLDSGADLVLSELSELPSRLREL